MLCSLKELELDTHDFAYGVIKPAALLNNYKPIDPARPSVPAGIRPGDKVFGSVVCAGVKSVAPAGVNLWSCVFDLGGTEKTLTVDYQNIHEWDLVAYDTKTDKVLGLDGLHAEQKEFPNCIDDGIFILHEDGIRPGDDILPVIGKDDQVVDFEITPNRPDCLCMEPIPSPRRVRVRPGFSSRSTPTMEERFLWSARCSAKTTKATGT